MGFISDFLRITEARGDNVALIDHRSQTTVSYSELRSNALAVGPYLRGLGVPQAGVVVSLLPNSIANLLLFLGCALDGAGFVPVSDAATPMDIEHTLGLLSVDLVILPPFPNRTVEQLLRNKGIRCTTARLDLDFSWLRGATDPGSPSGGSATGKLYIGTSGTTGAPRIIVSDIERLWAGSVAFAAVHEFIDSEARFFNNLSMSYLGGLLNLGLIPLVNGSSIVIGAPFSGRSVTELWHDVHRFDINILWTVPGVLRQLIHNVEMQGKDIYAGLHDGLRAVIVGMSPTNLDTKSRFEEYFGVPVLENYALSETGFIASETIGRRNREHPRCVGHLLPDVALRFEPVEEKSGAAEILVKTPYPFIGYIEARDQGISHPSAQDYITTGDIGRLSGDELYIDGRIRDVVKHGDQLVYLREIETLVERNPNVQAACGVLIPHELMGESYVLYVVLRDGAGHQAIQHVRSWLHENLPRPKWPQSIEAVADFPTTASGKIRKHLLSGNDKSQGQP